MEYTFGSTTPYFAQSPFDAAIEYRLRQRSGGVVPLFKRDEGVFVEVTPRSRDLVKLDSAIAFAIALAHRDNPALPPVSRSREKAFSKMAVAALFVSVLHLRGERVLAQQVLSAKSYLLSEISKTVSDPAHEAMRYIVGTGRLRARDRGGHFFYYLVLAAEWADTRAYMFRDELDGRWRDYHSAVRIAPALCVAFPATIEAIATMAWGMIVSDAKEMRRGFNLADQAVDEWKIVPPAQPEPTPAQSKPIPDQQPAAQPERTQVQPDRDWAPIECEWW